MAFDGPSNRRIARTVLESEARDRAGQLRRGRPAPIAAPGIRAAVAQGNIARDNFGLARPSSFSGDLEPAADPIQVYNPSGVTIWNNSLLYHTFGPTRPAVPTERCVVWTNSPTFFTARTASPALESDPVISVNFIAGIDGGGGEILPVTADALNYLEWDVPEIGTPILLREIDDPLATFLAVNVGWLIGGSVCRATGARDPAATGAYACRKTLLALRLI